jgi:hypothetical protein
MQQRETAKIAKIPDALDDSQAGIAEGAPIPVPENEYAFLQQILKNPIGDGLYQISLDAPHVAFAGRDSHKTLAQTAKKQLVARGIIEEVQRGSANSRAVVRLLIGNVQMSNRCRGRKVRRDGIGSSPKPSVRAVLPAPRIVPKAAVSAPTGRAIGGTAQNLLGRLLSEMRNSVEDFSEFQQALENIARHYPISFGRLLQAVQDGR